MKTQETEKKRDNTLFEVLNLLHTEHSYEWIYGIYHKVQPIVLLKWLSMDANTLPYIKNAESCLYYLTPLHQLIYLQVAIVRKPGISDNFYQLH